jgi:hypothetical protein
MDALFCAARVKFVDFREQADECMGGWGPLEESAAGGDELHLSYFNSLRHGAGCARHKLLTSLTKTEKPFPRRLKAALLAIVSGTAEAVPLQNISFVNTLSLAAQGR